MTPLTNEQVIWLKLGFQEEFIGLGSGFNTELTLDQILARVQKADPIELFNSFPIKNEDIRNLPLHDKDLTDKHREKLLQPVQLDTDGTKFWFTAEITPIQAETYHADSENLQFDISDL